MNLKQLCKESHEQAIKSGWWDNGRSFPETMMMVITELAESVQEDRKGNRDKTATELADAIIRLTDLIESLGIDIESEIEKKMEINKKREYKHGRLY